MKLYILARKDAPIGKVMAHVGHVCCDIVLKKRESYYRINQWYYKHDQTKIILEVKNEIEIDNQIEHLNLFYNMETSYYTIKDKHTKERYCLAIGPLTDDEAHQLGLKKLRLFK